MLKGKALLCREKKGVSEFNKHISDKKFQYQHRVIRFNIKEKVKKQRCETCNKKEE